MDFDDTPEEAAYRARVRAWIAANAPPERTTNPRATPIERLGMARAWQATKADAGYAAITQPRDWGGGGGTVMQQIIFNQEEEAAGVDFGAIGVGVALCVPLFLALGDPALKARHVRTIVRGESVWCQLFSEPSAGSDLANVRTRAVRDGEDWIVDGQKVWNSMAQYADFGILLARSDPSRPKHHGLTMFWIDMRAPGVEVRPIHQANGAREFNEVFLTGLRIPDTQRIGEVGGGWKAALLTLMHERMNVISATRRPNYEEILALARGVPDGEGTLLQDAAFRSDLAAWFVRAEGLRFTRMRLLTALSRGEAPGSEASIGKVVAAGQLQEVGAAGVELQDQYGIIADPDLAPMGGQFGQAFLYSPGARIGGGADEIMRNVIAERVLGLPGDVRLDRDVPFDRLAGAAAASGA